MAAIRAAAETLACLERHAHSLEFTDSFTRTAFTSVDEATDGVRRRARHTVPSVSPFLEYERRALQSEYESARAQLALRANEIGLSESMAALVAPHDSVHRFMMCTPPHSSLENELGLHADSTAFNYINNANAGPNEEKSASDLNKLRDNKRRGDDSMTCESALTMAALVTERERSLTGLHTAVTEAARANSAASLAKITAVSGTANTQESTEPEDEHDINCSNNIAQQDETNLESDVNTNDNEEHSEINPKDEADVFSESNITNDVSPAATASTERQKYAPRKRTTTRTLPPVSAGHGRPRLYPRDPVVLVDRVSSEPLWRQAQIDAWDRGYTRATQRIADSFRSKIGIAKSWRYPSTTGNSGSFGRKRDTLSTEDEAEIDEADEEELEESINAEALLEAQEAEDELAAIEAEAAAAAHEDAEDKTDSDAHTEGQAAAEKGDKLTPEQAAARMRHDRLVAHRARAQKAAQKIKLLIERAESIHGSLFPDISYAPALYFDTLARILLNVPVLPASVDAASVCVSAAASRNSALLALEQRLSNTMTELTEEEADVLPLLAWVNQQRSQLRFVLRRGILLRERAYAEMIERYRLHLLQAIASAWDAYDRHVRYRAQPKPQAQPPQPQVQQPVAQSLPVKHARPGRPRKPAPVVSDQPEPRAVDLQWAAFDALEWPSSTIAELTALTQQWCPEMPVLAPSALELASMERAQAALVCRGGGVAVVPAPMALAALASSSAALERVIIPSVRAYVTEVYAKYHQPSSSSTAYAVAFAGKSANNDDTDDAGEAKKKRKYTKRGDSLVANMESDTIPSAYLASLTTATALSSNATAATFLATAPGLASFTHHQLLTLATIITTETLRSAGITAAISATAPYLKQPQSRTGPTPVLNSEERALMSSAVVRSGDKKLRALVEAAIGAAAARLTSPLDPAVAALASSAVVATAHEHDAAAAKEGNEVNTALLRLLPGASGAQGGAHMSIWFDELPRFDIRSPIDGVALILSGVGAPAVVPHSTATSTEEKMTDDNSQPARAGAGATNVNATTVAATEMLRERVNASIKAGKAKKGKGKGNWGSSTSAGTDAANNSSSANSFDTAVQAEAAALSEDVAAYMHMQRDIRAVLALVERERLRQRYAPAHDDNGLDLGRGQGTNNDNTAEDGTIAVQNKLKEAEAHVAAVLVALSEQQQLIAGLSTDDAHNSSHSNDESSINTVATTRNTKTATDCGNVVSTIADTSSPFRRALDDRYAALPSAVRAVLGVATNTTDTDNSTSSSPALAAPSLSQQSANVWKSSQLSLLSSLSSFASSSPLLSPLAKARRGLVQRDLAAKLTAAHGPQEQEQTSSTVQQPLPSRMLRTALSAFGNAPVTAPATHSLSQYHFTDTILPVISTIPVITVAKELKLHSDRIIALHRREANSETGASFSVSTLHAAPTFSPVATAAAAAAAAVGGKARPAAAANAAAAAAASARSFMGVSTSPASATAADDGAESGYASGSGFASGSDADSSMGSALSPGLGETALRVFGNELNTIFSSTHSNDHSKATAAAAAVATAHMPGFPYISPSAAGKRESEQHELTELGQGPLAMTAAENAELLERRLRGLVDDDDGDYVADDMFAEFDVSEDDDFDHQRSSLNSARRHSHSPDHGHANYGGKIMTSSSFYSNNRVRRSTEGNVPEPFAALTARENLQLAQAAAMLDHANAARDNGSDRNSGSSAGGRGGYLANGVNAPVAAEAAAEAAVAAATAAADEVEAEAEAAAAEEEMRRIANEFNIDYATDITEDSYNSARVSSHSNFGSRRHGSPSSFSRYKSKTQKDE